MKIRSYSLPCTVQYTRFKLAPLPHIHTKTPTPKSYSPSNFHQLIRTQNHLETILWRLAYPWFQSTLWTCQQPRLAEYGRRHLLSVCGMVCGEEKSILYSQLEQLKQDKKTVVPARRAQRTNQGWTLSFVLLESPFISVSTVGRGHLSLLSLRATGLSLYLIFGESPAHGSGHYSLHMNRKTT